MRPRTPKPTGGVTILGPKFAGAITFEISGYKFHPPVRFDQTYVMLVVLLNGTPDMRKVYHAFNGEFALYLAEDCDLGKKHDLLQARPSVDGEIEFVVARPVEDNPDHTKH